MVSDPAHIPPFIISALKVCIAIQIHPHLTIHDMHYGPVPPKLGDGQIREFTARSFFAASVEENVTLDLTEDPSSVLLTWVNTEVPSGVNIVHYKVKYAEKTEEEQVGVVHTSSPEEVSLTVNELRTHQKYVFHVSVVVEETDGSLYEFGGSANGLEIYVPGMLQLITDLLATIIKTHAYTLLVCICTSKRTSHASWDCPWLYKDVQAKQNKLRSFIDLQRCPFIDGSI